ncbi:MAG: hypothetical protein RIB67_10465 [Miltoncostaeaceae bacterium]
MGLLRAMPPEGPPVLSWSTVGAPALVLGRSAGRPEVDEAAAAADGVAVVRRTSGGGPVLWDEHLVGLDVVLPPGHPLAPADVVEAYRWLGEGVATALRALGLPGVEVVGIARARAAEPGGAAAACYGGLSPFEVLVEGRKVLGLSQARRRPGTLLQAGVVLTLDAGRTARLMGRDRAFARDLAESAAGLQEWLPGLGTEDVVAAVEAAVEHATGLRPEADEPTPAEREAIAAALPETDPPRVATGT